MPATHYEVVVAGVGGMGSAAAYHLARRDVRVLGLERYDIPHTMGSSHGSTRIIRRVQNERPDYVPLIDRAYDLWRDLETQSGRDLLTITGSVHASAPGEDTYRNARAACEHAGIPYEDLTGAEVNDRYPGYNLPPDHRAVYQADGGYVACEDAIIAHVTQAHAHGATIHARTPVTGWDATTTGVTVHTPDQTYAADTLIIAAGGWAANLAPVLEDVLVPERRVMGWFQPHQPHQYSPARFPVFTVTVPEGHVYGFPVHDVPGFKIGNSPEDTPPTDPDTMNRDATPEDEHTLRRFVDTYFPGAAGPTMAIRPCVVTQSPDTDFIVDTHPDHPNVILAAGFSGNGYKFCSVIGETLADLATTHASPYQIDRITLDRLTPP